MNKLFITFILLCLFVNLYAQTSITKSDKYVPQWMSHLPKPSNPSFMYVVVTAEASTLEGAREACVKRLADNQQLRQSVTVNMDRESVQDVRQTVTNGRLNETINTYSKVKVNIKVTSLRYMQKMTLE